MQGSSSHRPHFDRQRPTPVAPTAVELARVIPLLRSRARHFCRDEQESEDLVQETLLRALEVDRGFGSSNHLRAWLLIVLRNLFVSARRHEVVGRRVLAQLAGGPGLARATCPHVDAPFLTPSIERALAGLPRSFAAVIRLVDLQDHAYEDAARALGIPVGTVMSRLFRGRRKLAALLDPPSAAPASSVDARPGPRALQSPLVA